MSRPSACSFLLVYVLTFTTFVLLLSLFLHLSYLSHKDENIAEGYRTKTTGHQANLLKISFLSFLNH